MNKIVIIFICLLAMQLPAKASDDKSITFEQLPAPAQQLIKDYFSGQSIALVKMDSDFFDKSYEVIFADGNKIEFDKKGNWKEIDCKHTQCPEQIVPVQIRNHITQHYPNSKIYKIEKESRNYYEVDLSNGISLEFDSNYRLIDIDN